MPLKCAPPRKTGSLSHRQYIDMVFIKALSIRPDILQTQFLRR